MRTWCRLSGDTCFLTSQHTAHTCVVAKLLASKHCISINGHYGLHLQKALEAALLLLLQVSERQEAAVLKLADLAVMSLQRARQIYPSEQCQILEQECSVRKKTHSLVPSSINAVRFQKCLTELAPCMNYS